MPHPELLFWLNLLVFLSGLGQVVLAIGSLAIPKVLGWKQELAKVNPLTRQMFWVYSAYIWTTNLCFGLVSLLAPGWLTAHTPLAAAVAGFIATYWGSRVVIQFTYFDTSELPKGWPYKLAEVSLVALFIFLTGVYGVAVWFNLT
ncbi:MAG: hypothetical protein ACAI44_23805 [Candidatus Sericytochromatia bacterium]